MRKGFYLVVICIGLSIKPFAQSQADSVFQPVDSYRTGKQIGFFRYGLSFLLPFNQAGNPVVFPGLTLSPGLRIFQTDNFIFSLSFPITAWGTFKYDYLLGIDLPIMIDVNIRTTPVDNQKSNAGFIVGIGYAYIDAVNNYDSQEGIYKRADFWGWRVEFGIDIGKENEQNDRDILFLSYGRSLADRRFWMIGLGVQITAHKF
jgi:hypothetical protein